MTNPTPQYAELARLLEAASGLPWQIKSDFLPEDRRTIIANVDGEIRPDGSTSYSYDFIAQCEDEFGDYHDACEANAALIVAAVNALPSLLATLTTLTTLQAENERLRDHIAEQIEHVEQRIEDGTEMGASVWRIALEDVARENRAALYPDNAGAAALTKDTTEGGGDAE